MSTIQLNSENAVELSEIESASLEEKGAKISSKVVSVSSGDWEDLRVPEDSLIVRLKDGGEFVIRGAEEAKRAWDQLKDAKEKQALAFNLNITKAE